MNIRAALLVPLVALAVSGCGEDDVPQVVDEAGFSFDVPAGWRLLDEDAAESAFESPEDAPPSRVEEPVVIIDEDESGSNITAAVQQGRPFPAEVDERSARLVERAYSNPALVAAYLPEGSEFTGAPETGESSLAGTKALDVRVTATVDEDEVVFRQLLVPHRGTGYVVQLAAASDDAGESEQSFEQVLESWSWK